MQMFPSYRNHFSEEAVERRAPLSVHAAIFQSSSSDEQARTINGFVLCCVRQVKALEDHLVTMGVTVVLKPFNIDQLVDAIGERLGADRARRPIDAEG